MGFPDTSGTSSRVAVCIFMHTQFNSGPIMKISPLSILAVLFVACGAGFAQTSVSIAYEYAPISYPGARVTNVAGINNSNVIVGFYYDSQDAVHGFSYKAGKYAAVNFPGATETQVLGINDGGDLVGMYQLPGNLNFHGFLRHGNNFVSLDDPSAGFGTMAFAINNAGTIVGNYDNAHGFVYQNGKFRTLDAPQLAGEPAQTQLNGISNLGWIVGQVYTGGIWRGFWVENGKLHYVESANQADSEAKGINGHSDIVGCHDSRAGFVSFLVGNYPSSLGTYPSQQPVVSCAVAINYARAVVGNYSTSSDSNGFLAAPALTLQVSNPPTTYFSTGAVHVVASASGNNAVSQMQVWINGKKVYCVGGASLNANVAVPAGKNERFVVQAIDSKGVVAKVVKTITVE